MNRSFVAEGLVDSEDMFGASASLPEQLAAAAAAAQSLSLGPLAPPSVIAMIGMGGSAVAGEVVAALGAGVLVAPVVLVNSYELPRAIDAHSLVFAVSFSGNTEETLQATNEAITAGAHVIAVTSGGELAEIARRRELLCVHMPETIPEPRAALGASLGPVLVLLEKAGLFPGASEAIAAAVIQAQQRRDSLVVGSGGLAGEIARRIGSTFPFLFAASGIGAVAARRWKTQINENAKQPAFVAVHPEACHNEIVGYGQSGDVTRQIFTMVELRSDYEHARVALRFGLVEEALREVMGEVLEVRAEGAGALAQLLDLILIGDFVSLELAARAGIDPGPVPLLVELKQALRASF